MILCGWMYGRGIGGGTRDKSIDDGGEGGNITVGARLRNRGISALALRLILYVVERCS